MSIFLLIFIFFVGAIIGSFLNVCAYRYNSGLSVWRGRSICPTCNTTLSFFDLFPLFSFLFLWGRCRYCKSTISVRYVVVEILTGFLFVLITLYSYQLFPSITLLPNGSLATFPVLYRIAWVLYHSIIASLLIIIALYDIKHKIIPQAVVYAFISLSFVYWFFPSFFGFTFFQFPQTYDLLAPLVLFLFFASIWYFSSGRAMGFGDAKLVLGMGVILGLPVGVSAVTIAFWIGAIYALGLIVYARYSNKNNIHFKSQIPFAPFLIIGYFIAFFIRLDVFYLQDILTLI